MTTHPALTIRRADERGYADHGWLKSRHTFSFANYYDPQHMGFRRLRVINEDRVSGGAGFGAHPHRDMEIISVVLDGALEHRDSMGNGSVMRAGEVQRMSAGTGVVHSEFNASDKEPVHFLQIWIEPAKRGVEPGYEQKLFEPAEQEGQLRLLVSPEGEDGSLRINQDAKLFGTRLSEGQSVEHRLEPGRHAWIQVAEGSIRANGETLKQGDAAALSANGDGADVTLVGDEAAHVLVFDLA